VSPAVILGYTTHRSQTGLPRFAQQVLEFVYRFDITTLRGSVHSLLEAEDMPMDFLPWDGLPGRHQGLLILCFGS
jgi:hypothetical protein